MPVSGDLGTMPLLDVLQWIGVAQKTGVLEIERGGVGRRIEFNKGYVGAIQASDRSAQLGQLLVARGMITDAQLDAAIVQQQASGNRLGYVLVELGALEESDVRRMIQAHVEQTIQCLFEWHDGEFRFYEGATFEPVHIEVNLSVDDVLLRIVQNQDELKPIREAFGSSGIVLRRTDTPAPAELTASETSRKIFESVDARRTIGEIVIRARAQEILVLKLLHRLLTMALVEVAEIRAVPSGTVTLLDSLPSLTASGRAPESSLDTPTALGQSGLDAELRVAEQLIDRGELGVAIELLRAASVALPADTRATERLTEVEALRWGGDATSLPPTHIPVRTRDTAEGGLDCEEAFLLNLIDGVTDVRSIVALAALREGEVLGALELMMKKGWIELREGASVVA